MSAEKINLKACAALLGVSRASFSEGGPGLDGFPRGERKGRHVFFDKAAVLAWAEGKDVRALCNAAIRQRRSQNPSPSLIRRLPEAKRAGSTQKALELGRRFAAGEFATAEQKAQFAMRRMTARLRQPKTIRVTLRPDWMIDKHPLTQQESA